MFDIGWSELLVIGVVALIVVGPKDLPVMFRTLGRITGKARAMAREFSRAMDDAARESGVNDISRDLKAATSKKALGLDVLEKAADRFEKWDPKLPSGQTQAKPAAAGAATPAATPMGPATQALADDRAAAGAARNGSAEPPVALPDPAAQSPAPGTIPAPGTPAPGTPAPGNIAKAAPEASPVKRIAKTRSRPDAAADPARKPAKVAKPKAPRAEAPPAEPPKRKRAKTDKGDA